MGLTITFTCASEIPIFACTGWLLRTFGVDPVLHIVLGTFILRFLLYTWLPAWNNPWLVLPIELLHGITFACAWAAGTVNCARIAPRGLKATTQAIYQVGSCPTLDAPSPRPPLRPHFLVFLVMLQLAAWGSSHQHSAAIAE